MVDTFLRTWKFKIKNAHLYKDLFRKWFDAYKYSYNKSNWLLKNSTCLYSDFDLCNIIIPKSVNSHIPWFLETPKDIRAEGVFENCKNWKSAKSNVKNGHQKSFDMGYLTKKKSKNRYCFGIPGSAIKVSCDRRRIQIYNDYTNSQLKESLISNSWLILNKKIPEKCINDKNFLLKEHKIFFNGENYYLCLVLEREQIEIVNRKKIVAIDEGVRKIATAWSPNNEYTFGNNKFKQIKDLLKKRDKYQSNNSKKNYIKIENRIKNLVNELHHKTTTFLCKRYRNIIAPELKVKELIKEKNLKHMKERQKKEYRKAMLRMNLSKFNELLKTKGEIYNTKIYSNEDGVTEMYSSRLCSSCKYINPKSSLEMKKCENCKNEMDRDINGAKNIYHMNRYLVN